MLKLRSRSFPPICLDAEKLIGGRYRRKQVASQQDRRVEHCRRFGVFVPPFLFTDDLVAIDGEIQCRNTTIKAQKYKRSGHQPRVTPRCDDLACSPSTTCFFRRSTKRPIALLAPGARMIFGYQRSLAPENRRSFHSRSHFSFSFPDSKS